MEEFIDSLDKNEKDWAPKVALRAQCTRSEKCNKRILKRGGNAKTCTFKIDIV